MGHSNVQFFSAELDMDRVLYEYSLCLYVYSQDIFTTVEELSIHVFKDF